MSFGSAKPATVLSSSTAPGFTTAYAPATTISPITGYATGMAPRAATVLPATTLPATTLPATTIPATVIPATTVAAPMVETRTVEYSAPVPVAAARIVHRPPTTSMIPTSPSTLTGETTTITKGPRFTAGSPDARAHVASSTAAAARRGPPVYQLHQFKVQGPSGTALLEFDDGKTLGDLRKALLLKFDIPIFEQRIVYTHHGEDQVLTGDNTVFLKEKIELLDSNKLLALSRQIDTRSKTEKETAFFTALTACRFDEAKEILESSGVAIDPNAIHKHRFATYRLAYTECPADYTHPALTVAIMAGFENCQNRPEAVEHFMSTENQVCEVVGLLIERNADVNATGNETEDCESGGTFEREGKTPLCAAVQRGSPALVRMLLDAKADPNLEGRMRGKILTPESWLSSISAGSLSPLSDKDPRQKYHQEILDMLRASS